MLAHSLGCAQAMNILLRQQENKEEGDMVKEIPVKYDAVCLVNPYFSPFQKKSMKMLKPYLNSKYKKDKSAFGPEIKQNDSKVPEHIHPWLYDFDNPF